MWKFEGAMAFERDPIELMKKTTTLTTTTTTTNNNAALRPDPQALALIKQLRRSTADVWTHMREKAEGLRQSFGEYMENLVYEWDDDELRML
jgi:hypothetical protein